MLLLLFCLNVLKTNYFSWVFIATQGLLWLQSAGFCSRGMRTLERMALVAMVKLLSYGLWDLVPWPGIKLGPPALGTQSQPLDHQGSPLASTFAVKFFKITSYLVHVSFWTSISLTPFHWGTEMCYHLTYKEWRKHSEYSKPNDNIFQLHLQLSLTMELALGPWSVSKDGVWDLETGQVPISCCLGDKCKGWSFKSHCTQWSGPEAEIRRYDLWKPKVKEAQVSENSEGLPQYSWNTYT